MLGCEADFVSAVTQRGRALTELGQIVISTY